MMVSLPDDAAFTICCSTDLFILALSAWNQSQKDNSVSIVWEQGDGD